MADTTTVLAVIGAITGAVGVFAGVMNAIKASSLEQEKGEIQKDLQRVQADLQKGLEHLRGDIEKDLRRFGALQERRINVLDDLYARLVRAERAFSEWTHPFQTGRLTEDERRAAAIDAGNEFRTFLLEHRIWVGSDLADQLMAVDSAFYKAFVDRTTWDVGDKGWSDQESRKFFREAWERVQNEIPEARKGIEAAFREILGVPHSEMSPSTAQDAPESLNEMPHPRPE